MACKQPKITNNQKLKSDITAVE